MAEEKSNSASEKRNSLFKKSGFNIFRREKREEKKEKKEESTLYRKKVKKNLLSGMSLEEAERKAKLDQQRRLSIRGGAKLAAAYFTKDKRMIRDITPAEKKAMKREFIRRSTHPWKGLSPIERRKDKKVAKKEVKRVTKKVAKRMVAKEALAILGETAPVWAPILISLVICLFGFLALVYYTCEGGGIIAWLLRRTALGNLCSM